MRQKKKVKKTYEVTCPYCSNKAEYVDSHHVYGKSYGMIWICWPCYAYVGTEKNSPKPLGTLANSELRVWRSKAHSAVRRLRSALSLERGQAYKMLSEGLNLPAKETHIALFDVGQCQQLIEFCKVQV